MSGRKPNPLEQKLHQAALADPKKTLTQKECEALIPDPGARTAALNFLLGTGLLKAMKDTKGAVSFRAVMKKELDVKKDMSGEEAMILSYIQGAANEGIWTKHLKAKTELHQTVIDRCIKSLTQKQLIKAVKSVKFPTRKIYMLAHLEPSVEMTGGPWYTDNELDTEFIKLLCSACLRFIRDRSSPKQKGGDSSSGSDLLYPISASPSYPTAQQILTFLSKSRITETQLGVEHVEMLLNVLVLDGEVERVPAFGAAMWDTSEDPGANASDDNSRRRKRKSRESSDSPKRKHKRSKRSRSTSESDSESESEDERERRKRRKKRKGRDDSESSASESKDERERRRRKKKLRLREGGADADADADLDAPADEDVEMSDEESRRKGKSKSRSKSKGKKRRKYDSSSSGSDSDSETDSDDDRHSRSRSRSKSKAKSKTKSKSSKRSRSSSPAPGAHFGDFDAFLDGGGGAYVYRAVRQERAAGGLSQAPCVRCPTFEFCKPGGPVNAQECTYYGTWLAAADVAKG